MTINEKVRDYRLKHNVKAQDVARELLLTPGQYSDIENGKTEIIYDNHEDFYYDVCCAVDKIKGKRVDRDGLEWVTVDDVILQQAIQYINKGKNLIQVCVLMGVHDGDLAKQLDRVGVTNYGVE